VTTRRRIGFSALAVDRRGTTAAEFALIVPALLILVFGSIELARFMWIRNSLQTAVEAAARCSAISAPACATVAAAKDYAVTIAGVPDATAAAFTVTTGGCGRTVTTSYNFAAIVPLVPLNATITAKSCRALKPGPG
jgi:Flp pilus assembly protein TadG